MCKALLVDNYDSFSYNLFQYMAEVSGHEPTVVRNDTDLRLLNLDDFDCAIISPGPGTPRRSFDLGVSASVILSGLPILGVCLGHQALAHLFGLEVKHAPAPMHGRISRIRHSGTGIFLGLPQTINVVRYHSLVVKSLIGSPFLLTAWGEDGMIHGIQHRTLPLFGVQFHPESICSEYGHDILRNFKDISITWNQEIQRHAATKIRNYSARSSLVLNSGFAEHG